MITQVSISGTAHLSGNAMSSVHSVKSGTLDCEIDGSKKLKQMVADILHNWVYEGDSYEFHYRILWS